MQIVEDLGQKILKQNEIDIVLHHGSCSDGFGSAFVVWYFYRKLYYNCNIDIIKVDSPYGAGTGTIHRVTYYNFSDEVEHVIDFIPCYFQKEMKNFTPEFMVAMTRKNILLCDFSYKYELLVQLINVSNTFAILDHHKTAEADLIDIPDVLKIFDMKRSGCGITWDFFFPDVARPKFLEHVQDRDIWTNIIPNTNEFVAYFYEQDFDFNLWYTYMNEDTVKSAIEKGKHWLEYQTVLIDKMIKKTSYIIQEINNKYQIVLYCNSPLLQSDLGNRVFDRFPMGDFSSIWDYDLHNDKTSYSFRSTNDRTDVSAIALSLGGGGHRNAAGAILAGYAPCLPFKRVDDVGIMQLLLHGTKGKIDINSDVQTYTLFKVKEIRKEWTEENYLNLIKRKCNDSVYIVFEKETEKVDYDDKSGEIMPLKEYDVFFNEKSYKEDIRLIGFMACCQKDHAITFVSKYEFSKIFCQNKNPQNIDSDPKSDPDIE